MSSSDGSAKLRRKERDWKPKLKERGQKAKVTDSGSSQAAQLAMANMTDIGRRRDRGLEVDEDYLTKVRDAIDPGASLKAQAAPIRAPQERPRRLIFAGMAVLGCGLLWFCAVAFQPRRHSVDGTLLFERQPLSAVEIVFHPAEGDGTPATATTSTEGTFKVSGLPAGPYRITVRDADDSGPAIPSVYAKPEDTPLRVNITTDLHSMSMYVTQPKRR